MSENNEYNQSPAARRRQSELPPFYYLDHFLEFLTFIQQHYGDILKLDEVKFIADFQALSRLAQALYVRLVNRKGQVFALDKLNYPELGNLTPLAQELFVNSFTGAPEPDNYEALLHFLRKDQILEGLRANLAGVPKNLKKAELIGFALTHCRPQTFVDHVVLDDVIVQRKSSTVDYLLFLYFGKISDGTKRFTERAMGITRSYNLTDRYQSRFQSGEDARENFYFATRVHVAEQSALTHRELDSLSQEALIWPDPKTAQGARHRDKLAYQLGSLESKRGNASKAIELYQQGESTQCIERAIRLLFQENRKEDAGVFLERCMASPRTDEEAVFAQDLYNRKFNKKRTLASTDELRSAQTISLDESYIGSPEKAALDWFDRHGVSAFRTENRLWRMLFGLVFWDELFSQENSSVHSPFDALPESLKSNTFYQTCSNAIEKRLEKIAHKKSLSVHILKISTQHLGRRNGVFRWSQRTLEAVFNLVRNAPPNSLETMLRHMSKAYSTMSHGYPDLMIIEDKQARFVEIKTQGDQLRRNQLVKLQQLRDAGFSAQILCVQWSVDPKQQYVVVDVETTGGRKPQHRVTEIGAVKIQGGEIIDRFSTLVNPDRLIPPNITRLTGISNAMVQSAPRFEEVAEQFTQFLGNSIFVAHNVAFDYGFIAQEYDRLGKRFKMPKLCTVVLMRKFYPGLRSYSLAALTREYDISLKTHHRALCDAEAAGQLLLMVNEKRAPG